MTSRSPEQVSEAADRLRAATIDRTRIAGWDISFCDTVAANASSGLFVLGAQRLTLADFEPHDTSVTLYVDGMAASTGTGAACLGDPLRALTWLARRSPWAMRGSTPAF